MSDASFLGGGELGISDHYGIDFSVIQSQLEWELILSHFWEDAEAFAQCVERMGDAQLNASFVGEKYGTIQ